MSGLSRDSEFLEGVSAEELEAEPSTAQGWVKDTKGNLMKLPEGRGGTSIRNADPERVSAQEQIGMELQGLAKPAHVLLSNYKEARRDR